MNKEKELQGNGDECGLKVSRSVKSGERTDFFTGNLWDEVHDKAQKLSVYLGRKFLLNEHDREDCFQRIITEFLDMVQDYDPGIKTPEDYISGTMFVIRKREIKYLAQEANRFNRLRDNYQRIKYLRDCEEEDGPKVVEPQDIILKLTVDEAIENLTEEQKLLCQYLKDGFNATEIASFMGIHRSTVHRRIQELRDIFTKSQNF